LAFVVSETLARRGEQLKEHTIGVTVYHRPLKYDPKIDAIVRVEAIKLRRRLHLFYEGEGSRAEILIQLRKGSYAPEFSRRHDPSERQEAEELIAKGNYLLLKFNERFTLDACSFFRQAVEADPSSVRARNALLNSLCFASAVELLPPLPRMAEVAGLVETAQALEDNDSDTHVSAMIVSGFQRGDFAAAIAAGRRALDLNPSNVMAYVWAGAILIGLGKLNEAENLFRRAIRVHPGIFFFRVGYAMALRYGGQVRRSRDVAVELAGWEPEYWPIRWFLAQVYATLGQYDEAIATAEGAFSVHCPPMALSRLAWLYASAGFREKAEIALQRLQATSAHCYVASSGIGAIYAALGRPEEARAHACAALAMREPLLSHASVDARLAPLARLMPPVSS
jgi:tetratricopeptide (TPR) repeat protein